MKKNIYLNIILVFLCLYTFLIGIKGLSSAINKISSPDDIFVGDQVQLKYILVDEVKIKKAWVEVKSDPDENGDFDYALEIINKYQGIEDTIKRANHFSNVAIDSIDIFKNNQFKEKLVSLVSTSISRIY